LSGRSRLKDIDSSKQAGYVPYRIARRLTNDSDMSMRERTTLRQQLRAFADGRIIDSDGGESECYNFYDWFCKGTSLKNKAEALFKKLERILPLLPGVDQENTYVFFKNNCPMCGSLYDDFRICDLESGDVIYCITPSCGHDSSRGEASIWGRANKFDGPLVTATGWGELVKKLKDPSVLAGK